MESGKQGMTQSRTFKLLGVGTEPNCDSVRIHKGNEGTSPIHVGKCFYSARAVFCVHHTPNRIKRRALRTVVGLT